MTVVNVPDAEMNEHVTPLGPVADLTTVPDDVSWKRRSYSLAIERPLLEETAKGRRLPLSLNKSLNISSNDNFDGSRSTYHQCHPNERTFIPHTARDNAPRRLRRKTPPSIGGTSAPPVGYVSWISDSSLDTVDEEWGEKSFRKSSVSPLQSQEALLDPTDGEQRIAPSSSNDPQRNPPHPPDTVLNFTGAPDASLALKPLETQSYVNYVCRTDDEIPQRTHFQVPQVNHCQQHLQSTYMDTREADLRVRGNFNVEVGVSHSAVVPEESHVCSACLALFSDQVSEPEEDNETHQSQNSLWHCAVSSAKDRKTTTVSVKHCTCRRPLSLTPVTKSLSVSKDSLLSNHSLPVQSIPYNSEDRIPTLRGIPKAFSASSLKSEGISLSEPNTSPESVRDSSVIAPPSSPINLHLTAGVGDSDASLVSSATGGTINRAFIEDRRDARTYASSKDNLYVCEGESLALQVGDCVPSSQFSFAPKPEEEDSSSKTSVVVEVNGLEFKSESPREEVKRPAPAVSHCPEEGIVHEKSPPEDVETDVFKTRFWILGTFSALALLQCITWGTFGPIMESAKLAFGWGDSNIALLSSWAPIATVLFSVPINALSPKFGLRKGVLIASALTASGNILRCFTSFPTAFTVLANVGAIVNGLAGCLTLSLPAMVAAIWFPPSERTTAMATGALMSQLGGAVMYLAPLIVDTPPDFPTQEDVDNITSDIMILMYIYAAGTSLLFVGILCYFPNKPPLPPSVSATMERYDYYRSFKKIFQNGSVLLVVLTYMFSFGIPVVWIGVMNFSLQCLGIKQHDSMWVAITAVSVSGLAAFLTARMTDCLYGHLKLTSIALLSGSTLFFLWFLLLDQEVIPMSLSQVYISVTGAIALEYASVPILIELAVEMSFPCPEVVIGTFLTEMFNIVAAIFLILLLIPTQCYHWVNFILVASTGLTIVSLLFVTETHHRSNMDRNTS